MSKEEQRKLVESQFKKFRKLCADLPNNCAYENYEREENDPPDVLIEELGIGIEFTDFMHGWTKKKGGSKFRAREEILDKIIKQAQLDFEQKHANPLMVSFFWTSWDYHSAENRPHRHEIQQMKDTIVDIINSVMPLEDKEKDISWDRFQNTPLENELDRIIVRNYSALDSGFWSNVHGGAVGFGKEAFEKVTLSKEDDLPWEKHPHIRSRWLVITTNDGEQFSSVIVPDGSVRPGCITSKFDRVYFFNFLGNQIKLLTVP